MGIIEGIDNNFIVIYKGILLFIPVDTEQLKIPLLELVVIHSFKYKKFVINPLFCSD